MNIALIALSGITGGGIVTVSHNLYRGLVSEEVHVDVIRFSEGGIPSALSRSL
jgi:hypothetical protein